MTTIVIQIGNSDNKLTQQEWSSFVSQMNRLINKIVHRIFFCGGSNWDSPRQNACWVGEVTTEQYDKLIDCIQRCRKKFKQDAVAVTLGQTRFV